MGSSPIISANWLRFQRTIKNLNSAEVKRLRYYPVTVNGAGSTPVSAAINNDFVAQLVEHLTFNQGVMGSSPIGVTIQWVVKVVRIRQPDCKSGPQGGGSSPRLPTNGVKGLEND